MGLSRSNNRSLISNVVALDESVYFSLFKVLGFNNAGYFFRNDRKHIGYVMFHKAVILFLRSYGYTYDDLRYYLNESPCNYDFKTNRKSDSFFGLDFVLEGSGLLEFLYNELMSCVGVMGRRFVCCGVSRTLVIRDLLCNFSNLSGLLGLSGCGLGLVDSDRMKRNDWVNLSVSGYSFASVVLLYRSFYYNDWDISAVLGCSLWNVRMCLRRGLGLDGMVSVLSGYYDKLSVYCSDRVSLLSKDFVWRYLE